MYDYYSLNKVIMVGTVGRRQPERKKTSNDRSYARFSIYTSERRSGPNGRETKNTTHLIVTWGHQADFAADYLRPGMKICVEGKLSSQAYEMDGDRKVFLDGGGGGYNEGQERAVRHYSTEIVANNITIIDNGRDGEGGYGGGGGGGNYGGGGGGNYGGGGGGGNYGGGGGNYGGGGGGGNYGGGGGGGNYGGGGGGGNYGGGGGGGRRDGGGGGGGGGNYGGPNIPPPPDDDDIPF